MRCAVRTTISGIAAAMVALTCAIGWPLTPTRAMSPDSAPALPAPTGSVINVSTVAALQSAVSAVASNQTIVIAPGTYNLTSTLWLNGAKANVTIRGATNNRNDVVLVGQGMGVASASVPFGIWTGGGVTHLTIANLTIRNIYQHPIMMNAGTEAPRLYNVRLLDGGEQLLKANPDGTGGGVDNGVVEYSVFEYTTHAPTDYTNGVDVHTGRDWVIRHNLFRRIRAPQGQLAGPAVLIWNASSGTIVESNTFIDNHRDISLGLIQRTPNDHAGGIVRNNFITRTAGSGGDVAIAVFASPSTKIVHNTIWMNGQYPNAIETRFANTTGVAIVSNLADRPAQNRDGASSAMQGNVWTAASSWFTNTATGDLHLTAAATGAIDRGVPSSDAPFDWDGQARPSGSAPDVGADESSGTTTPPPPDTTPPSVSLTSPSGGATIAGTVTLAASAADNVGVAGVRFLVNGVAVGPEDTAAPWQLPWNTMTAANGSVGIQAIARDTAGNTRTSATVSVTVSNQVADTTSPTVQLTTPAGGATVAGTVGVTASASDNVGVVSVQFTLNGINVGGPDTSAPWSVSWNTTDVANGAHTLRATARDAAGNVATSTARTVTVANGPSTVASRRDLNGDQRPDLLFQHTGGALHGWFMNDNQRIGESALSPATLGASWRAVALDDFNADGQADVLWQHRTQGTLAAWILRGTVRVIETGISGAGPTAWRVAATGDVNGDGHTDIIWQHPPTGLVKIWLMRHWSLMMETGLTPYRADVNWRVAASADFNQDGRDDIVWQHRQTGQISVYIMGSDGRTASNIQNVSPSSMTPGWLVRAAGDFNRNGSADLIWQHVQTGALAIWNLSGFHLVREAGLSPGQLDPAWKLAGDD